VRQESIAGNVDKQNHYPNFTRIDATKKMVDRIVAKFANSQRFAKRKFIQKA
jgi:hypothetical protein